MDSNIFALTERYVKNGRVDPNPDSQQQQQQKSNDIVRSYDGDQNGVDGSSTESNKLTNGVATTAASIVAGGPPRRGSRDNLRDIGTWSNDQADNTRGNKRPGGGLRGPGNYAATATRGRYAAAAAGADKTATETEQDEEEWQGDLTKTQIFTSSTVTQKKTDGSAMPGGVANSSSTNAMPNAANAISSQQTCFPIVSHFNAEEAAQNIKKAVGVSIFLLLLFSIFNLIEELFRSTRFNSYVFI